VARGARAPRPAGRNPLTGAPQPWLPGEAPSEDARRHAPATLRNRDAILAVLQSELPTTGTILEIASGSGEHIVHFAAAMPALNWHPSDPDPSALASIAAHAGQTLLANLAPPALIDAAAADWPVTRADALLCCNMVHIAPWSAAQGLFAGAGRLLLPGAPLLLYGPFIEADVPTADSNLAFDASLKDRNPEWGLRDVTALDALAQSAGLRRTHRIAMPANNLMLVWRRV
jgi:Protein of unknown function (DUF938)